MILGGFLFFGFRYKLVFLGLLGEMGGVRFSLETYI